MKKTLLILLGIIVTVVIILFISAFGFKNKAVTADEKVSAAWANVENQYQRRADLIPNLVATVKGYAKHEEGTLTEVMNARAQATQIKLDASSLTEENLKQFQQAQGQLGLALNKLMAVAEAYPDLKANQNFLELQAQLEGTENRIAVERRNFTDTVREYNVLIRKFPNSIFAGMFGFDKKAQFAAVEGAAQAPQVQF